jgi:hypothetical protein
VAANSGIANCLFSAPSESSTIVDKVRFTSGVTDLNSLHAVRAASGAKKVLSGVVSAHIQSMGRWGNQGSPGWGNSDVRRFCRMEDKFLSEKA